MKHEINYEIQYYHFLISLLRECGFDNDITMTTESCIKYIECFINTKVVIDENGDLSPMTTAFYGEWGTGFQYQLSIFEKQTIVLVQNNTDNFIPYDDYVKPLKRKDKIANILKDD